MSIRVRLTLWYTALLASILLIFCVAVYNIFTSSQDSEINRTLEEVARDLLVTTMVERPVMFSNQRIVIPRLSTFSPSTVYVQVWDAQGEWQASSDNVEKYRVPLDAQALSERSQQPQIRDVSIENAEASFELLLHRAKPDYQPPFELVDFMVVVETRRRQPTRNSLEETLAEAMIKVRVGMVSLLVTLRLSHLQSG